MKVNDIIKSIENGQVPDTLKVITDFIQELNRVFSSITPVSAILIASARRENFEPNDDGARDWIRWSQDNFGFNDSYIHQLRKVGNMLLDTMATDKDLYMELLTVSFDKLYYLSRLDLDPFNAFIQDNDIHALSRDEVRDAVNEELGSPNKTPGAKPKQGVFPDQMQQMEFSFFINDIASWNEEIISQAAVNTDINVTSAAGASTRLLGITIHKLEAGEKLNSEDRSKLLITLQQSIELINEIGD